MTTIEKIERGIITLAEFTEDQQSFIKGIVKLSFNEGQEQALRIHDVVGQSEQLNFLINEAVEKEKNNIRQFLLDEGYELLSEKI